MLFCAGRGDSTHFTESHVLVESSLKAGGSMPKVSIVSIGRTDVSKTHSITGTVGFRIMSSKAQPLSQGENG